MVARWLLGRFYGSSLCFQFRCRKNSDNLAVFDNIWWRRDRVHGSRFTYRRGQFGYFIADIDNDTLMWCFAEPDVVLKHENNIKDNTDETQNEFSRNSIEKLENFLFINKKYPLIPLISPLEKASKNNWAIDKTPPTKSKITFCTCQPTVDFRT